ncbi:hypothetical protein A2Z33_01110 [Candidatus Gottesmanbacteria bacterium RBG_16_52_11]|uniref:RNA-binding protein KhpA n=1 Tax=Candidatus Gottesmanbacteria bacterium RBG_16_52_11 TaxID=1798374 RepID=A0A1F5YP11_9BACT|nr:MAG: hypothetical protein A2Z33_01110 [Candidatus Gottesmanbacteria bacterium RBG_16_52_11]
MKETLLYILKNIVDHPEDVEVTETTGDSRTILSVRVHTDDMGKVIGKQGRIIRAIRDLIKLMAARNNTYADVVLKEE